MNGMRALFALGAVLALGLLSPRADAQVAPDAAVACVSEGQLWSFLDARDGNDADKIRRLLQGDCRVLGNATYSFVTGRNGTANSRLQETGGLGIGRDDVYARRDAGAGSRRQHGRAAIGVLSLPAGTRVGTAR